MNKIFYLFLSAILLPLNGCNERLTYAEFKGKYDWAETACMLNTAGSRCSFEHNGVRYNPRIRIPITFHNRYMLLYDKNAPDQNFLVQLDKPIKPDPIEVVRTEGRINYITKYVNFVEIEYEAKTNIKRNILLKNKNVEAHWVRQFDYLPLNYYDKLKLIKEKKLLLSIDWYIVNIDSDGNGLGSIFINREALDSLNL